jgi:hypothetical protein
MMERLYPISFIIDSNVDNDSDTMIKLSICKHGMDMCQRNCVANAPLIHIRCRSATAVHAESRARALVDRNIVTMKSMNMNNAHNSISGGIDRCRGMRALTLS